jgi:putative tryptophan/tyrosine transport system substrate-binding protein
LSTDIQGKIDRAPELAAQLVRLKVDVIVVAGVSGPILAAKNATTTIPIVMAALSADPIGLGLVESLAIPAATSLAHNYFQRVRREAVGVVKEAVTKVGRVAVLYDSTIRAVQSR